MPQDATRERVGIALADLSGGLPNLVRALWVWYIRHGHIHFWDFVLNYLKEHFMADATLDGLVADVEAKETALATAIGNNNTAQAAATAAMAAAASTLQAQTAAQSDLNTSVQALVTYAESLESPAPTPAPTPTPAAPTAS
jgi:hypothetical protein